MSPNLDFHDPAWRELRALLRRAGYTTEAVRRALSLEVSDDVLLSDTGRYSYYYDRKLSGVKSAAAVLGRLFLFSSHVPVSGLGALPRRLERLLWGLDLIEPGPEGENTVKGTATVVEYRGMYFVADVLFEHRGNEMVVREDENCMPLHASSIELLHGMRTPPGASSVLDVGCGSGCVSLLSDGDYQRITGFDPFARAVDFARVNSVVNGVPADYTVDQWETFDAGHGYDSVLFNAPSPQAGVAFLNDALERLMSPTGVAHVRFDCEITHADADLSGFLDRTVSLPEGMRITATVHEDSLFSLSAHNIETRTMPRATLLVHEPSEAAAYLEALAAADVLEVVCATFTVSRS